MRVINLVISLFSIIKIKALECSSVINQECRPRPKILNVNEGIGEALFYPYNVLVNKCSGSSDTLMRLNETRNVLWHEGCKCACRLNSSVCNSKQIWNSDTCRCDCNEDFAGIINCAKGCTWYPSTCECQCEMWCKPGQYLVHKNCVCKNKLIGRVTEECTSIINETMMNNDNDNDNNTTWFNSINYVFIGLFLITLIICFCVFAYFKWLKGKKLFKNKYINY